MLNNTGRISKTNNPVLVKTLVKLDFRNRKDSGKRRILSVIATYLLTNTLLVITFFLNSSKERFILLSLSLNFFLASFILLSEYAELFFSKRIGEIISSLPLKDNELFFSKSAAGMLYLSVYTFTLALPQAIYFYFFDKNIFEAVYYFFVSLLFSYFAIGLVFLLNTLFLYNLKGKTKIPIIIFQVLFVFFVLYINRLLSSTPPDYIPAEFSLISYFPQYFLLLSFGNKAYFLFATSATILVYVTAYLLFRNKYSDISALLNTAGTVSRKKNYMLFFNKLMRNIEGILISNKTEHASFYLVINMFKNSAVLKMRMLILFFMPLIALIVGLILNVQEMISLQWGTNELLIISPSLSVIILLSLKLIISGFKTSIDQETSVKWIYDSIPIVDKLLFLRGCIKFTILYYLIPVMLISGILLTGKIPVFDILLNFLYLISFILVFAEVLIKIDGVMPFTADNMRLNTVTKFTDILVAFLAGTILFVSQIIIFKNVIFTISTVVLFLIIYLFLTEFKINKKNT